MPQANQCLSSQFYSHDPHLVCSVHPAGVEGKCFDFRKDPNSQIQEGEQWNPEGYYWWDGELLPNRPLTLTREQQLTILDSHPVFTGVCLKCGYEFDRNNLPFIHWDCPACGWVDDSV